MGRKVAECILNFEAEVPTGKGRGQPYSLEPLKEIPFRRLQELELMGLEYDIELGDINRVASVSGTVGNPQDAFL
jgi:hypothetical protein